MAAIPRFTPSIGSGTIMRLFLSTISGSRTGENEIDAFESGFARYIGVSDAILVPSARVGLHLILKYVGFGEQGEIILPSYTYHSIPSTIVGLGLKPVFVDIEKQTYLMDPGNIGDVISEKTRAVIPTHLYGQPCSMDDIQTALQGHDIAVIEDCAQSCGAEYKGTKTGAIGEAGYFTFGLTKNMTCLTGGMITTNNEELATMIRGELKMYGAVPKSVTFKTLLMAFIMNMVTHPAGFTVSLYPFLRVMGMLDKDLLQDMFDEPVHVYSREEIQAFNRNYPNFIHALAGNSQLGIIDWINERRRAVGERYIKNLADVDEIQLPVIPDDRTHIFLNFVIRAKNRDLLARELLKSGIDTAKGYMRACSAIEQYGWHGKPCTESEAAERNTLHLPIYPTLKDSAIDFISERVRRIVMES